MQTIQTSLLNRKVKIVDKAEIPYSLTFHRASEATIVSVFLKASVPTYTLLMNDGSLKEVDTQYFRVFLPFEENEEHERLKAQWREYRNGE